MQVIIKKSDAAEPFTFSFVDDAGKTILRSENYKAKSSCTNGVESVKKNCTTDSHFELKESTNGKFYFNVKSSNGQVVGTSIMYASETDREKAISTLMNEGPSAAVDDQS